MSATKEQRAEAFMDKAEVARQNALAHESEMDRLAAEFLTARRMCDPRLHPSVEWLAYWRADADRIGAQFDAARARVAEFRAEARKHEASAAIVRKEG